MINGVFDEFLKITHLSFNLDHYNAVIMSTMTSQITSVSSTVRSGANQR